MLEGFPACRIAFDSMAEVACEAAKVAYKEKIGDLQSASVEERPGIVSALEALGLQLETMGQVSELTLTLTGDCEVSQ